MRSGRRPPHRRLCMTRSALLWLFVVFCLLATLNLPAHAQYRAGIQGTVTDASGAVIPDATVTLTSKETNASRQTTSNAAGTYTFNGLAPGNYSITGEKSGFQKQ